MIKCKATAGLISCYNKIHKAKSNDKNAKTTSYIETRKVRYDDRILYAIHKFRTPLPQLGSSQGLLAFPS